MAQQEGQRLNLVLADHVNDLQFIAQLQTLSAYAEQLGKGHFRNSEAQADLAQMVEHEFHNLLLHGKDYQQLRFIDTNGIESGTLRLLQSTIQEFYQRRLHWVGGRTLRSLKQVEHGVYVRMAVLARSVRAVVAASGGGANGGGAS